jgi:hypothetical protein
LQAGDVLHTFNIDDSTIVGNVIGLQNAGTVPTLQNTIIAQNSSNDVSGSVSGSYNLIGNGTALSGLSNGVNHNQVGTAAAPINPLLGNLLNNGGNTVTESPATNSPAINTGIGISSISTDQRGDMRPTSGAVDIGAVQLQTMTATISGAAIYLKLAAGTQTLDVFYNNTGTGTPAVTYPLGTLAALTATGTSGNDMLTIDYSNGIPIPSGSGFSYDGLAGTNTLKVIGTAGNDTIAFNAAKNPSKNYSVFLSCGQIV